MQKNSHQPVQTVPLYGSSPKSAWAILPPAWPVITTPLDNVVGMTAIRKRPRTIPVSIGIKAKAKATMGAIKPQ